MIKKYLILVFSIIANVHITSAQNEISRFNAEASLKFPYVGFNLGLSYKVCSAIEVGVGMDFNGTYTLGRWFEAKYFISESFKSCQFKKHQAFVITQLNSSSKGKYVVELDDKFSTYAISEGLYINLGLGYRKNTLIKPKGVNDKNQVLGLSVKAYFQGAMHGAKYNLIEGDGNTKTEKHLARNLGNYFFVSVGFCFVL